MSDENRIEPEFPKLTEWDIIENRKVALGHALEYARISQSTWGDPNVVITYAKAFEDFLNGKVNEKA